MISGLLIPISYFFKVWAYYPKLDKMLQEELNMPEMPSVQEIEKRTDLVFVNSHFSEEYARNLPPFVVNVGGLHIVDDKNEKLPTVIL